jgi:hypothetical protein
MERVDRVHVGCKYGVFEASWEREFGSIADITAILQLEMEH